MTGIAAHGGQHLPAAGAFRAGGGTDRHGLLRAHGHAHLRDDEQIRQRGGVHAGEEIIAGGDGEIHLRLQTLADGLVGTRRLQRAVDGGAEGGDARPLRHLLLGERVAVVGLHHLVEQDVAPVVAGAVGHRQPDLVAGERQNGGEETGHGVEDQEQRVTPYVTLQQARDTSRCIRIAFLAEGYKQEEMATFEADCRTATEALFAHEPFKSMRDRFNVVAVEAPSQESGTSEPGKGVWKDTPLRSHFDTFYSDRYLTTLHLKALHDCLAGTPYEHIIVLVNTENYGGGGILNSYNLAMAHHKAFKPVVVHEFGHSFAGLADEYAYEAEQIPMYPHDIEPWEPNITTQVNFHNKWENLIGKEEGVGLYEGAGYSLKGVWRGCKDCRMRTNEHPVFCPVCQQALTRLINFYTE